MFDFDGFAERVETEQHSEQRKVLAVQTMDRVRAQLVTLAGLGYQFDLVDLAPHPSVAMVPQPVELVPEPISVDPAKALAPAKPPAPISAVAPAKSV